MFRSMKTGSVLLLGARVLLLQPAAASADVPAHGLVHLDTVSGDWSGLPVQDNPWFGFSVAVDGDWLAVGAPRSIVDGGVHGVMRHGAVFLFQRENGAWQPRQRILASGYGDSGCGYSVALAMPLLVVGCPGADNATPSTNAGQVRWYRLVGEQWTYEYGWNEVGGGICGFSVDIAEGRTPGSAVLAYGCTGWNDGQGFVRVWTHAPEGGWAIETSLFADDGAADDRFGRSVSLSVETGVASGFRRIAVGAPLKDAGSGPYSGKAYVFDGTVAWTESGAMTLYEPLGDESVFYGSAVALRGDDLLVGAYNADAANCPTNGGCGAVQRYRWMAGAWSLENTAWIESNANTGGNPPGPQNGMFFGSALAFGFDDMVAVGASGTDGFTWNDGLAVDVGLVDLRSAGNLHERHGEVRPALSALAVSGGRFGTSIDFGHPWMAVGYPQSGILTINGPVRYGSVYLYARERIFADGFE